MAHAPPATVIGQDGSVPIAAETGRGRCICDVMGDWERDKDKDVHSKTSLGSLNRYLPNDKSYPP